MSHRSAPGEQPGAQGPRNDGEGDVIDRAAARLAHLAQVIESQVDRGEQALLTHLHDERIGLVRAHCRNDGGDGIPDCLARRADPATHDIHQRIRMGDHVAEGARDEFDRARSARGAPCRHGSAAHLIGFLEDDLADVHRGHAVDHRLVRLAEECEAIPLDAFDQVHLPERVAPVERPAHDPGDEVIELAQRAGCRQGGSAYVEGDVEALIVDPDGRGESPGHLAQPLPVARDVGDAIADELDEALVIQGARLLLEESEAADVHGRGRALEIEERRVESGEAVGHDAIVPRRPA